VPRDVCRFSDRRYYRTGVSPIRKTARTHGISGYTNYLLKGTQPIRGEKMATPNKPHPPHNHHEKIPGETKTSSDRQHRP
jgi:hypothetical protein